MKKMPTGLWRSIPDRLGALRAMAATGGGDQQGEAQRESRWGGGRTDTLKAAQGPRPGQGG